jgi:large subunit ribosomal protein L18e
LNLVKEENNMAKKVIKTNPNLFKLIRTLKIKSNQEDVAIWKDVASKLEGSNRSTAEVNVSSINRYANENEVVLVPGKVLSNGNLDKKVTVAALNFSSKAQEKIENAGGECLTISEILEQNPKGSNIRIMQ